MQPNTKNYLRAPSLPPLFCSALHGPRRVTCPIRAAAGNANQQQPPRPHIKRLHRPHETKQLGVLQEEDGTPGRLSLTVVSPSMSLAAWGSNTDESSRLIVAASCLLYAPSVLLLSFNPFCPQLSIVPSGKGCFHSLLPFSTFSPKSVIDQYLFTFPIYPR